MNRVLLNTIDHADLRVAIRAGAAFGDDVNQAPIFPSEFEEAQRAFPIIFREEDGAIQPYMRCSASTATRICSSPGIAGRATMSRSSSGAAPSRSRSARRRRATTTVRWCISTSPIRASARADGLPLFKEHGGTAPLLDHMTEVLRTIYQGMETVAAICAAWRDDADLLRPITLQIALDDGRTYEVPDIFTVDRQALADLSGEPLERLHRHGLLAGAILAAASARQPSSG